MHAGWEQRAAFPVQGDEKPVKRAHLSRFWSLKCMFGALVLPGHDL